jgi:hypothetical protein
MPAVCLFLLVSLPAAESVTFDGHVLPVLTQAGCNAAACHGAAAGRGGLRLSLFGGDPEADYDSIVHQFEGRRVNLVRPAHSLLLAKPGELLEHGGGLRLDPDGLGAALLTQWISQGARRALDDLPTGLRVEPASLRLDQVGAESQVRAWAELADGSRREVTSLCLIRPDDPAALQVRDHGRLVAQRRGRHVAVVRYGRHLATVEVLVPLADERPPVGPAARANWIDDALQSGFDRLHLSPAPPATWEVLVRRLYLDLTGRLPTADEAQSLARDQGTDRLERLVDRLLASPDFADYWTFRWARTLRVQSGTVEPEATAALHSWLREQITSRRPWHEVVRSLLTANGDSLAVGPAAFQRLGGDARGQAELVSEALLGLRLRCANCHSHPFDRWTQEDYHGLAAVFARVERGRFVRLLSQGEVTNPRTGGPAALRLPGGGPLDSPPDARAALAGWLTAPGQRELARATANRCWQWLFGRGLVEPVDDLRPTNPPLHPPLLDRLADALVDSQYDQHGLVRLLVTSAAYSRAARPEGVSGAGDGYFAWSVARPLPAEVLADALQDVAGAPLGLANWPAGTRTVRLPDAATAAPLVDVLGRCPGEGGCAAGSAGVASLAAQLALLNGPLVNELVVAPQGWLAQGLHSGKSDEALLDALYWRAFARPPRAAELAHWRQQFAGLDADRRRACWEDLLWSVLCSRELTTNH